MAAKKPKPDPAAEAELRRQQETAFADHVSSIQGRVGTLTDQLLRLYGRRAAFSSNTLTSPPLIGGLRGVLLDGIRSGPLGKLPLFQAR